MFLLRRVAGDSMAPTLRAEQLVLAVRFLPVRPGHVVVLRHDGIEKIKRVQQVADGQIFVLGDNADCSTDSRNFGWLPYKAAVARVVLPRNMRSIAR